MAYSKYKNRKVTIDGITYDSVLESKRGAELILQEKAGLISDLQRQTNYDLYVNGHKICTYRADFDYIREGRPVTEDAKSAFLESRDRAFPLKRKLFASLMGREIELWPAREAKRVVRRSKKDPGLRTVAVRRLPLRNAARSR
jgi:hypothetical protein